MEKDNMKKGQPKKSTAWEQCNLQRVKQERSGKTKKSAI